MSIEEEIINILKEYSDKKNINKHDDLKKDLCITSFDYLLIISKIIKKYKITYDIKEFENVKNVNDLIIYIERISNNENKNSRKF